MRVFLLVAALVLAGCADPNPTPGSNDEATDPAAEPMWMTLNLTSNGRLSTGAVEAAAVELAWGYPDWLAGTPPPAWHGDVVTAPYRVLEGTLTLNFRATAAQAGGNLRPEMTAWWGSTQSIVHHLFMDGADVVQSGDTLRGETALRVPMGGMVYATGDVPFLSVGSYYLDNPAAGTMELLVGGDDASRLDLLVEPVELPGLSPPVASQNTFSVAGGRCVADLNPNGIAAGSFSLEVEGATHITLRLSRTYGGPTPDVDFAISNAAGDTISRGQSSLGEEGIDLWGPNFDAAGAGPYTVTVYACTAQIVIMTVDVETYT